MQAQEYRFKAGRISSEVAGILLLGGVLEAFLWLSQGQSRVRPEPLLGGLAGVVAVLISFVACRWRSRLCLSREGVEWRRSSNQVVTRIAWDEVDELFLLGPSEFEVRGAGKRIRFGEAYDRVGEAQLACTASLEGLRSRLRDRALREGELVFRTPSSRWAGHAAYLATILLLTILTGAVVVWFMKSIRTGIPFVLVFFGGSWLWRLRSRASRLGTRVTLSRDGLEIRRLDGRDRVGWSEILRTEWTNRGDLRLLLVRGKEILLPSTLANISILAEFVEEGREPGEGA